MDITLTRIFVKVVQQGSFSRAGLALQMPKSTVSKAVTRLERETGTKLLIRSTRSQSLTAAGRLFFETCLAPLQVLEEAQKSLYGKDNIVSGHVKITAPEDLGNFVIAPAIGALLVKYPALRLHLNYTNEIVDLVKDGYDFAVRIGPLKESSLRARRIGEIELVPVAAPKYLKGRGKISAPEELAAHSCLSISGIDLAEEWVLKREKKTAVVRIRPVVEANQVTSLLTAAVSGAGISMLPLYLCQEDLAAGRLVRVLPHWCGPRALVSLVSPMPLAGSARLKLVSEEIEAALRGALAGA